MAASLAAMLLGPTTRGAPVAEPVSEEDELQRQLNELLMEQRTPATPEVTRRQQVFATLADALSRYGAGIARDPSLQTNAVRELIRQRRTRVAEQRDIERTERERKIASLETRRKEARQERLADEGFEKQKELIGYQDTLAQARDYTEFVRNQDMADKAYARSLERAEKEHGYRLDEIETKFGKQARLAAEEREGAAASLAMSLVVDYVKDGRLEAMILEQKVPPNDIINQFQLELSTLRGQGLSDTDRLLAISELNKQMMRILQKSSAGAGGGGGGGGPKPIQGAYPGGTQDPSLLLERPSLAEFLRSLFSTDYTGPAVPRGYIEPRDRPGAGGRLPGSAR